jgi:hypothetical protein
MDEYGAEGQPSRRFCCIGREESVVDPRLAVTVLKNKAVAEIRRFSKTIQTARKSRVEQTMSTNLGDEAALGSPRGGLDLIVKGVISFTAAV